MRTRCRWASEVRAHTCVECVPPRRPAAHVAAPLIWLALKILLIDRDSGRAGCFGCLDESGNKCVDDGERTSPSRVCV